MSQHDETNAFKKIIPKDKLTPEDKEAVLKTIETAKLLMEAFDLISTKHIQTRFKMATGMGGLDKK